MAKKEVVVKTRKCPCFGHHEVGMVDKDGKFVPFKNGMKVTVKED